MGTNTIRSERFDGETCPACHEGFLFFIRVAEPPDEWLRCNECEARYLIELAITPKFNELLSTFQQAVDHQAETTPQRLGQLAEEMAKARGLNPESMSLLSHGFFMGPGGELNQLSDKALDALRWMP